MATSINKPSRSDSRRQHVLDAAAELFADRGYHATSIRDIAKGIGASPGAVYAHFGSKAQLLVAVYEEGAGGIGEAVDRAVAVASDAWDCLEAACRAHLETLLEPSPYARVVIRVHPGDIPEIESELIAVRDRYEARFRQPLEALGDRVEAIWPRLMLLGAMNWAPYWYRPGAGQRPSDIAERFVHILRHGCDRQVTGGYADD